jgi:hypothetical protein
VQEFDFGHIVAIPLTMEIDDLPHAMRYGRSPRQFVESFGDLLGHVLASEDEALMIDVTAYAHCYGQPGGTWAFEAIARNVMWRDDVWVDTRADVATSVRCNQARRTVARRRGSQPPRGRWSTDQS